MSKHPIVHNGNSHFYPGDIGPLIDHVKANARKTANVINGCNVEPPHFEWIKSLWPPVARWVHHVSWMDSRTPKDKSGQWVSGFPHIHSRPESVTMITYLSECEGGEIVIWEGDTGVIAEYTPEPGLVVFTGGHDRHGVLAVTGGDRLTIHTTGYFAGGSQHYSTNFNTTFKRI